MDFIGESVREIDGRRWKERERKKEGEREREREISRDRETRRIQIKLNVDMIHFWRALLFC